MQNAKQFLTKTFLVRLLPVVLIGWVSQSCNNSVQVVDDPPAPAPTRTRDSLLVYSVGDAVLPDAATWKIGKDSGKADFLVVEKRTKDSTIVAAVLDHKVFSDTLKILYWKYGILVQTRLYLPDGADANDLPDYVTGGKILQSSNNLLLAALSDAHKLDSVLFPLSRVGVTATFASLIVSHDTRLKFPDSLPSGIARDSVEDVVIILAVSKKLLGKDLLETQLGMTLDQIKARLQSLKDQKKVPDDADKILFPPSTMNWVESFGVAAATVKQGESLGLKGVLSTGSPWKKTSIEILDKDGKSVSSQFAITAPADSTTLVFTSVAKLIPSADLGAYKVRFSATNEKGDSTSQTANFDVVKSDDPAVVLPPQITRLQPSGKDSTLDFGTETVVVKWKVKDDSRYKIVATAINGMEAVIGTDSTYSIEVKLAPGKDSVVSFKATSSSTKFSVDAVTLHRSKDLVKPTITKLSWAFDSALNSAGAYEFGKEDVSVKIKWSIEDNYKFHPDSAACIVIAGKIVSRLDLSVDPKNPLKAEVSYDYAVPNLYSSVILRVKDAAGNTEDYPVVFVRPQKEGDILAEWDRFNWDAPKVVWQ